jgi:ubiquinone/menaquinone biosynthesis C-methylase UbiE
LHQLVAQKWYVEAKVSYKKQVEKSHYDFSSYMSKARWCSIWHQLDEISKLKPETVLEIGTGPGVLKILAATLGVKVETLDIDPDLNPDYVASATSIPFNDATYDVVCAFQMLEHLPYELSLKAFGEMVRVCQRNVVISLPDAHNVWRFERYIPKLVTYDIRLPRQKFILPVHNFDGEHYWEINTRDYPLRRVISDFSQNANLDKTYLVHEHPYHRFFIFNRFNSN